MIYFEESCNGVTLEKKTPLNGFKEINNNILQAWNKVTNSKNWNFFKYKITFSELLYNLD